MSADKGPEDFLRDVNRALKDGLLSEGEWTVKMGEASSYSLSPEQAELLVIERCVEQGAVIEHFEIQKLRDLIAIAAPDKVLAASVQDLLRRLAEERYRHTKLADPQAHVDRLVGERLSEANLRKEELLRQKISERLLAAAGQSRSIRIEDYRRTYREMLQELGISGSLSSSDLVGIFLDCRHGLGIDIAEPEPIPPPPPPPPPTVKRAPGKTVPKPVEHPPIWVSLGKLLLLSLAVAVLVYFLLLRYYGREGGSAEERSISLDNPSCDGECETNLQIWIEELQEVGPSERARVVAQIVNACDPYLILPAEEMKSAAREADPDWELCDSSMIQEAYQAKASGRER